MHLIGLERARGTLHDGALSVHQIQHGELPVGGEIHVVANGVHAGLHEFQRVQARAHLGVFGLVRQRLEVVDQVFTDPGRGSVEADHVLAVLDVNRARAAVQAQPIPIPQLEGEYVWRGADLQHHAVAGRAVHRARRNQKVVVLLRGEEVDVSLRVKRAFAGLGALQVCDHRLRIHALLQPQIHAAALARIEDVVALVLGVGHAEVGADVFGVRMHLQAQVLAAHGVQEIEADRVFRAEACECALAQHRAGQVLNQVHGGGFHAHVAIAQQQAVLLRHAVKAPGEVGRVAVEAADLLHPLTAPDAGVEVGRQPERLSGHGAQSRPEARAGDQLRRGGVVGVQIEVDFVVQIALVPVGDAPLHEEAALVFAQDVLVLVVLLVVGHALPVAQLNLPAGQIGVHQHVAPGHQRCAEAVYQRGSLAGGHRLARSLKRRFVQKVQNGSVVHHAAHAILCQMTLHPSGQLVAVGEHVAHVDGQRRTNGAL